MTLFSYRDRHGEALVQGLAAALSAHFPDDAFEPLPVVVGSRGMDRWLRHELATRLRIAARIDFLFPGTAFEDAARWLAVPAPEPSAVFWQTAGAVRPWSRTTLSTRVLSQLRAHVDTAPFERVRRYLGAGREAATAREVTFAEEVAAVIERLHHDRPDWVLEVAADPSRAEDEHVWLAVLLRDLGSLEPGSPAALLRALEQRPPLGLRRPLFVYGLSTLRPGDRRRFAALARHVDVHLFSLVPSSVWWEDVKKERDLVRELSGATTDDQRQALLAQLERQNVLLSSLGAPSQALQLWLEQVGYEEPNVIGSEVEARGLLGRLQRYLDLAEENPRAEDAPWREHRECKSVAVHACHGPLRQCEALREALLERFAADATLEPRHVLVMTPDLGTYAPLIGAVFARTSEADAAPKLPVHIADLGLSATSALAEVLLRLISLGEQRVTARELVELISLPPVRARFGLDDDALGLLRELAAESGMRWAWDAQDRARHDQPALDGNTLRFGLERLALGALVEDAGGLTTLPAVAPLGPTVPLPLRSRERLACFGALAEVAERVRVAVDELAVPRTASAWRTSLLAKLDELVEGDGPFADEKRAARRARLVEAMEEALPDGGELPLERAAVAAVLQRALEHGASGDRPQTGAITVSGMEPMRSVPFRVVCIVGLDDGVFPRAARPAAWDPFARPRFGELDRRDVDRHLFLEAILSARDALLLFGTGFEPKRGKPVPLSVVVTELLELIGAGTGDGPDARLTRHPLQPWSAERTFDRVWRVGSERLAGPRVTAGLWASRAEAAWPSAALPSSIPAETLARWLDKPQRALLRGRLGLRLDAAELELEEREPLEADSLETYKLIDLVLETPGACADADILAQLGDRLRGEGKLPLSAAGHAQLLDAVCKARAVLAEVDRLGGEEPGRTFSTRVGALEVTAHAPTLRRAAEGLLLVRPSAAAKPGNGTVLGAWISLLVARMSDPTIVGARVVGREDTVRLAALDVDASRAHLEDLAALAADVLSRPVPLFSELSRSLLDDHRKEPDADLETLARALSGAWHGELMEAGVLDDPWASALFGHWSIEDVAAHAARMLELAERVWGPVRFESARKQGKSE
jgi:exodeoxyribonuclease V gamma subunit